ncbi:MAG: transporter substrate-binding domain-containing protein [Marinobacter sp.]|nr:transporter substrate-binding domain-containing protein [Marinobacter sp.]
MPFARTLFVAVMLLCVSLPIRADALHVVVGINHAPPYRIISETGVSGFYVEIFNEIATRAGWRVSYREAPFRRILMMAEQDEIDVMLGPLPTTERRDYMDFSIAAFPPERRIFLYLNETSRVRQYEDLASKRIGVLRGSTYFPTFDEDPALNKVEATSYDNLLTMLEYGRIDLVIAPEMVGIYTAQRNKIPVRVAPFFVPGETSYIGIALGSPLMEERAVIQQYLNEIKEENLYERLLLKYQGTHAGP